MTFISYAQNYEDVVLWRALRDVEYGFYVDVGAADPTIDSVTKAFYERGWSGINIEPTEPYFSALESQRPRDINLRVLAGARPGVRNLHIIEGVGLSTINGDFAARHVRAGYKSRALVFPELQLNQILEAQAGVEIHFLKIDVEGAESDVLSGIDLKAFRPWIILVEASEPNSQTTTRHLWEHFLINRGYEFAYFDGLNCFYTAIERAHLKEKLAVPPNIFDNFLPFSQARLQDDVIQQTQRAQALVEAQSAAMTDLHGLAEEIRTLSRTTNDLRLDSRLIALEELSADLKRSLLTEFADIVIKVNELNDTASVSNFRTQYLLDRSILEKLFFRVDGRPVKWLRRLLFHKSNKPRKLFRTLVSHKNGEPRRAFSYWMTSKEQHHNAPLGSPPAGHALSDEEFERERALCVELVYRYYLGRTADADALGVCVGALRNGMKLSALARAIENSPEAVNRRRYTLSDEELEHERALCVELVYRYYLGRTADADALGVYVGALRNGMTPSALARAIENSPEAVERRQHRRDFDAPSDGEFVVALAEFLFQGRGALPEEVEHWKNVLVDDRAMRIEVLIGAAESLLANKRGGGQSQYDPAYCWIMGTDRWIVPGTWESKARDLLSAPRGEPLRRQGEATAFPTFGRICRLCDREHVQRRSPHRKIPGEYCRPNHLRSQRVDYH